MLRSVTTHLPHKRRHQSQVGCGKHREDRYKQLHFELIHEATLTGCRWNKYKFIAWAVGSENALSTVMHVAVQYLTMVPIKPSITL